MTGMYVSSVRVEGFVIVKKNSAVVEVEIDPLNDVQMIRAELAFVWKPCCR